MWTETIYASSEFRMPRGYRTNETCKWGGRNDSKLVSGTSHWLVPARLGRTWKDPAHPQEILGSNVFGNFDGARFCSSDDKDRDGRYPTHQKTYNYCTPSGFFRARKFPSLHLRIWSSPSSTAGISLPPWSCHLQLQYLTNYGVGAICLSWGSASQTRSGRI